MLRKLKKALPAVVSAVLCVTMLLGITASAEKKNASDVNVWSETKALTNAKYYKSYIQLAAKYSDKEAKNTIAYSKSKTKQFYDKLHKAAEAEKPQFSLGIIDKEQLVYCACKDDKAKVVICIYDMGLGIYTDSSKVTMLDVEEKIKVSEELDDDPYSNDIAAEIADSLDFEISENAKGKYFKLKSGENIYYYEEFESDYNSVGFLFSEGGSPLAIVVDDEVFCIRFRTSVDDSEFDLPTGYKTVNIDDFDY